MDEVKNKEQLKNKPKTKKFIFLASLQTKLIIIFFVVGLVPVMATVFFSLDTVRKETKSTLSDNLYTIVQLKANASSWGIKKQIENISFLAETDLIQEALESNDISVEKQQVMIRELQELKGVSPEVLKMTIINKKGDIVASTDTAALGSSKQSVLEALLEDGVFIKKPHMSNSFGIPAMDYGLPVLSEAGDFIGGIYFDISLNEIYKIGLNSTGLKETGKSYLVNADGLAISPLESLGNDETFLKKRIDTVGAKMCLERYKKYLDENNEVERHEESLIVYDDYRGVEVLGAHAYVPEMDACLLMEVDKAEAFITEKLIINKMLGMALFFFIIVMMLSLLFAKFILKPIFGLIKGVEHISRGDFKHRLNKRSNDEIDTLIAAFNVMADKLEHSKEDTDRQIKDKTKELATVNASLDKIVKEKTKELQNTNVMLDKKVLTRTKELSDQMIQLEKINKTMVDREMKMITLKNELEELKNKDKK